MTTYIFRIHQIYRNFPHSSISDRICFHTIRWWRGWKLPGAVPNGMSYVVSGTTRTLNINLLVLSVSYIYSFSYSHQFPQNQSHSRIPHLLTLLTSTLLPTCMLLTNRSHPADNACLPFSKCSLSPGLNLILVSVAPGDEVSRKTCLRCPGWV